MSTLINLIRKGFLIVLVTGLGLAAFPAYTALAEGMGEDTTPPTEDPTRLEQAWKRELTIYERQGHLLDRADGIIDKVQEMLERARDRGLDTAAVETALAEFQDAIQEAHPVHQSAQGIVNPHLGFDENGNVTDANRARETISELKDNLAGFRTIMNGTGRSLREIIRAFIEANRPSESTVR